MSKPKARLGRPPSTQTRLVRHIQPGSSVLLSHTGFYCEVTKRRPCSLQAMVSHERKRRPHLVFITHHAPDGRFAVACYERFEALDERETT